MRTWSLLVALSLLMVPLALADGHEPSSSGSSSGSSGSGSSGDDGADDKNATDDRDEPDESHNGTDTKRSGLKETCEDAEDRERCAKRYCDAHPRDRDCQAFDRYRKYCQENPRDDRCEKREVDDREMDDRERDDRRPATVAAACLRMKSAAACAALEDLALIHSEAKHVSFEVDRDGKRLLNYTVGGKRLLDAVEYDDDDDEFRVERKGNQMQFRTDDARLTVHDTPTGTMWFKSDDESIFLIFPSGANITLTDEGARIQYDGYRALLVGDDIEQYDGGLMISGHAMLHAPVAGTSTPGLEKAIEKRHVGAEMKLRSNGGDDDEVVTYDDVNVTIERRPAKITANDTLRVVFDAHLDSGRTMVLDIDPAMLAGPELVLRYFDVHDDGNQTEVVFNQASSLADILDPNDDGGQPEYYVVTDANGTLQVMVSVPQWSVHAIELASIGEFLVQPSVLVGVVAGVAGVGVATLAMFRPRRD